MNKQIQYALTTMTLLIRILLVVSCTFTTAPIGTIPALLVS